MPINWNQFGGGLVGGAQQGLSLVNQMRMAPLDFQLRQVQIAKAQRELIDQMRMDPLELQIKEAQIAKAQREQEIFDRDNQMRAAGEFGLSGVPKDLQLTRPEGVKAALELSQIQAMQQRQAQNANKQNRLPPSEAEKLLDRQQGLNDLQALEDRISMTGESTMGPFKMRSLAAMGDMGVETPEVIEAQETQALYDDVRQAIGKAKESGVLRKEDEIKYLKIIGSGNLTPKAASGILKGLKERYQYDYENRIAGLSDLGYNVPPTFNTVRKGGRVGKSSQPSQGGPRKQRTASGIEFTTEP
jgi:hypothetical protein